MNKMITVEQAVLRKATRRSELMLHNSEHQRITKAKAWTEETYAVWQARWQELYNEVCHYEAVLNEHVTTIPNIPEWSGEIYE